jgi:hypothetical protein
MVPAPFFTWAVTPSDLAAPCPAGAAHFLAGSWGHALGAVALRYLVKFSVVPDSSER